MKLAFFLLVTVGCLGSRPEATNDFQTSDSYCEKIDTLVSKGSASNNFYANRIIPELEKASGLMASCDKGYFGYMYKSEILFDADIRKWRAYFKCSK